MLNSNRGRDRRSTLDAARPLSSPHRPARACPISRVVVLCLAASLLSVLVGCADDQPGPAANTANSAAPTASKANPPTSGSGTELASSNTGRSLRKPPAQHAARDPRERPIPGFGGTTLAGTRLAVRDLLGSRILFFFFNPEVDQAKPVSQAVSGIAKEAAANNFKVVGVGIGSNPAKLTRFKQELDLAFPIIDDSSGSITKTLNLRSPMAALGIDAEGYMTFGLGGFPTDGDIEAAVSKDLRERMRLPAADATTQAGALLAYPAAPELGVIAMSTGDQIKTADLKGRAAIVIFFLHTCPHCHKALESIKKTIAGMKEDEKPRLVAISINNAPSAIRSAMKELGLDFFDPYLDPGQKATDRWGVTGGVPVVTVLDPEGRIRHRSSGWNEKRDGAILRMKVAQAAGATVPMILDPKGYSGSEICGTCHETEFATWQYTTHASAYDTLVTHGADRRTDCVGCHVVGFEEKGGFNFRTRPAHLEDVGCESCHGRGGPHLSPDFVPAGDASQDGAPNYEAVCGTCHNATHSLGFEYASFHERVSHKKIASMSNAERAKLMEGGPSRDLLPSQADYVGSDACQSCHEAEFKVWEESPHGHAVETLAKEGKAGEAECLACHTTAYGKTGGFPKGAAFGDHPDLARVGCESCHGAGGDHIGENAKRVGTIISLGDKCDSCVILKICGSCHDDANDPGFQFKVEERIDAQRHGTIESAITRGEADSAFRHEPGVAHPIPDHALLREAFDHLAAGADHLAAGALDADAS
ncbi:MAG: multiheme c-type cytochrome [Myxococcota bacterium]